MSLNKSVNKAPKKKRKKEDTLFEEAMNIYNSPLISKHTPVRLEDQSKITHSSTYKNSIHSTWYWAKV